jgi:hypothetical protein
LLHVFERAWHRFAAAGALVGAAFLAAFVTVPPDLTKTTWTTEWIARVGIGLASFFLAIAVIGTVHWIAVRGIPPTQLGLHPFSIGYSDAASGGTDAGLEELRAVDRRLDRELANVANLLNLVVARLTTLEGRTSVVERALGRQGGPGDP